MGCASTVLTNNGNSSINITALVTTTVVTVIIQLMFVLMSLQQMGSLKFSAVMTDVDLV